MGHLYTKGVCFFWDQTYTIVVIRPLIEVGGSFKGQKRSHRAQGQGDENFFAIEYAFFEKIEFNIKTFIVILIVASMIFDMCLYC